MKIGMGPGVRGGERALVRLVQALSACQKGRVKTGNQGSHFRFFLYGGNLFFTAVISFKFRSKYEKVPTL